MKNFFFILVICCSILTVTAEKSFSSHKAYTQKGIARTFSQKKILNAAEVSRLFNDKTVNVLSEKTEKKTRKHVKYRAYFSEMGTLLVVFENGAREPRTWSVKADGALCLRRIKRIHGGGGLFCGYVVPEGKGIYKMYKAKHVNVKDGRVIGGRHIKQLVTFSNFKKGNTLSLE